jgi:ABC-type polysaccharide/polyol phosphate transport system ATPase subunit
VNSSALAETPADSREEIKGINYVVDIVSLSKRFKRHTILKSGYTTIKSSILRFMFDRKPKVANYTTAVKDLTLRIPAGSAVGIIGRNGSGKSTLLKLITGIYKADSGSIAIKGRIAALIELGAGFHPDFTGRENLYLGGVMHGLTRAEIDDRFDEIVRFAELEHVIDDPVRTYSSGMFMRLGFSLAVHTDPDLLIVDEVLAVGDAAFVSKCKERIARLHKDGKTLLLVTHDLDAVERWCDEAIWLHQGEVMDRGHPRRVIDHYRQFVEKGEESDLRREIEETARFEQSEESGNVPVEDNGESEEAMRWGSREIEITQTRMLDARGDPRLLFHPHDDLSIEIDYLVREKSDDVVFGIGINRSDGLVVHGSNTDIERVEIPSLRGRGTVRYQITRLGLLDGNYSLDVAVHRKDGYPMDYHKTAIKFAVRSSIRQIGVWEPEHRWEFTQT